MKDLFDLYCKHVNIHFGDGTYSKELFELSFISQMNAWAIQLKPTIIFDGTVSPFSISTLCFAGSGLGKDSSIEFLNGVQKEVVKEINSIYTLRYDFMQNELSEKDDEPVVDGQFKVKKFSDRIKSEMLTAFERFPKEITLFSKSGTKEGLNSFYRAYSALGIGSIGVSSSEFGDHYQEKEFRDLVELVAQFFNNCNPDSLKVTSGNGAIKANNIQSSIRLHSSFEKFKRKQSLLEDLQIFMASSLARRTLFFYLNRNEANILRKKKIEYKSEKIKKLKLQKDLHEVCEDNAETEFLIDLRNRVMEPIRYYSNVYKSKTEIKPDMSFVNPKIEFRLNKESYNRLMEYGLENNIKALECNESDNLDDVRLSDEMDSRHFKALRVAALSSFYKLKNKRIIDIDDIEYGIKIAERSGEYYKIISKPSIIVDDVCDYINKINQKVTVKQLEDMEIIPRGVTKYKLEDIFSRCREKLYQRNKIFRSTTKESNMIPEIWIEQLEETKNEIAHIAYSTVESPQDTYMEAISVPFYDILKIEGIKKVSSGGFAGDKRSIDNVSLLGNVLFFDCDDAEALSIRQMMDTLRGYAALIYPTKSNLKEKHGVICERYRVAILCKQRLPYGGKDKKTSELEYKQIYRAVAEHFGIKADMSCCDLSRFFYVNDEAKKENVIKNGAMAERGKGTLLDLRYFMKNLKMHDDVKQASQVFNSSKFWGMIGVKKILEKCIQNAIITENRNNSLLVMALSLKDAGLSYKKITDYVYEVDDKFPMGSLSADNSKEIEMTILKTLKNRMVSENIYPDGKNASLNKKYKNNLNGGFMISEEIVDIDDPDLEDIGVKLEDLY